MKLKLFLDKKHNRVLYAEAGKDFVDVLLHTLMKPFGLVMKQDFDGAIVGGLANLYTSVANDLSVDYLLSGTTTKAAFLNPNLLKTFYTNRKCKSCQAIVTDVAAQCQTYGCYTGLYDKIVYKALPNNSIQMGQGYVKGQVTYMITDDLVVKPLSTSLSMMLLSQLRITDFSCVQEAEVTFDSGKLMELVKASLTSNTVLTDTFLPLKQAKS